MQSSSIFQKATGPVLIALAAVAGAITLTRTDPGKSLIDPFADGKTQTELEAALNEAVPLRALSISSWNALKYAAFGEMLEGGVAGRDGWLYTAEEYRLPKGYTEKFDDSLQTIQDAAAQLSKAGVRLYIAVVPDKSRIVTAHLRHPRPAWVEARYQAIIDRLSADGLSVIDLRPAMLSLGDRAYLQQDTHWSAEGARSAAIAIAAAVGDQSTTKYETKQTGQIARVGDLVRYVSPGPYANAIGMGPQDIPLYTTTAKTDPTEDPASADALFGTAPAIPGVLVGTSYSALKEWNFHGFLQEYLGAELLDASAEGRGPFTPMQDYLAAFESRDLPQFVIWEIPERYFTVEP